MTPASLKAWRKRLGLSQQAAADALGVSRRIVQRYEADELPIPLTVELACAAVALGIRRYDGPEKRAAA